MPQLVIKPVGGDQLTVTVDNPATVAEVKAAICSAAEAYADKALRAIGGRG